MSKSKGARRPSSNSRIKPSKKLGRESSPTTSSELNDSPFRIAPGMLRDPVWMIATGLFAAVAIGTLTKNGLWNDEWLKQMEFSTLSSSGASHSLHYALGRSWARLFGVGPFALRFLWSLFAIGCIPLSYLLGRLLGDRRLARTACLLLATSPYLLFYAQDANYYAEMMFYALAVAVGLGTFLATGQPLGLLLAIVCTALLYLVHPFGAVGGGALMLGGLGGSIGSRSSRQRWAAMLRSASSSPLILTAMALGGAVLATIAYRSGLVGRLWSDGWEFLRHFHLGGSYTNVALNGRFLTQTLREFGPGIVSDTIGLRVLAWIYAVIALVGTATLFRRKPWATGMLAMLFAVTGVVVFCFKIDRFFHVRYISYLVPFYLLGVAAGLRALGDALHARFSHSRFIEHAPLTVLLVLIVPGLWNHLNFDGGYMKNVARHLESRWTEDDRMVSYQMVWPAAPISPPGIEPEQHIEMPWKVTINQGWLNDAYFKRTLVEHPSSWLLHHWNERGTFHRPLLSWADQWMSRVVEAPSIFQSSQIQWYNREPRNSPLPSVGAVLHRWDWPDRYVAAPHDFRIDLASERYLPRFELKSRLGLVNLEIDEEKRRLTWRSSFLFEHPGRYRFTLLPSEEAMASPLTVSLNGRLLDRYVRSLPLEEANGARRLEFLGEISSMRNELTITAEIDPAAEDVPTLLPTLLIDADYQGGFWVNPFFFGPPDPQTGWLKGSVSGDRKELIFKRNESVTYRLNIPETGLYRLRFHGVEDRPGPVVLDLLLDGDPLGILNFGRANGQWSTRDVIEELQAGPRELTVSFLFELNVSARDPDKDNDLIFGGFEVRSALPEDVDQRHGVNDRLIPAAAGPPSNFVDFRIPDGLGEGWAFAGDTELQVQSDPSARAASDGGEARMITLVVEPRSEGATLASPAILGFPGQYLYFDCELRVQDLGNHSANIQVNFHNTRGEIVGRAFVNRSGLTGTTQWKRLGFFADMPTDSVAATIRLVVYPNGSRPHHNVGKAFFRRLRLIEL